MLSKSKPFSSNMNNTICSSYMHSYTFNRNTFRFAHRILVLLVSFWYKCDDYTTGECHYSFVAEQRMFKMCVDCDCWSVAKMFVRSSSMCVYMFALMKLSDYWPKDTDYFCIVARIFIIRIQWLCVCDCVFEVVWQRWENRFKHTNKTSKRKSIGQKEIACFLSYQWH